MEFDAAWEGHQVSDQVDTALLESEVGLTLGFSRVVARRMSQSHADAVVELPGARALVQRVGDVVIRPAAPWTPALIALLGHLERVGFDGAPRVFGTGYDETGRETVEYVEGDFVHPHAWSDQGIFQLGGLLRRFHDASASFEPSGGEVWQDWFTRSDAPDAIIGHGDPGPWNIVAREGLPVALIDWEFAGPVDRIDEVAHAARLNAQLHDDDIALLNGLPTAEDRVKQLRLFLDGYGLSSKEREGFAGRLIETAILDCANEAIQGRIAPDSTDTRWLWGLAWRSRSAAWMLRHRQLLERAISGNALSG